MIDYGDPKNHWQGKPDTRYFRDPRLKPADIVVLSYLLNQPASWNPNQVHLRQQLNFGESTMGRVFRDLIKYRYAARRDEPLPAAGGRKRTHYTLYADPTRHPDGPKKHPVDVPPDDGGSLEPDAPRRALDELSTVKPSATDGSVFDLSPAIGKLTSGNEENIAPAQAPRGLSPRKPVNKTQPQPAVEKHSPIVTRDKRSITSAGACAKPSSDSFADQLASMGADLPGEVNTQDQARVHYGESRARRIPADWLPSTPICDLLVNVFKINGDWLSDQFPEFHTYWSDRKAARHSWDAIFITYAKKQWKRKFDLQASKAHGTYYERPAGRRHEATDSMLDNALRPDASDAYIDPDAPFAWHADDAEFGGPFGGPITR
jgi:hypothetical protein